MLPVNNLIPNGATTANSAPKILLITAYRWLTTSRLALALAEAGLAVEALCPAGHSLERVNFVLKVHRYRPLSPLRSVRNAIEASNPDLIIPSDDTTAAQLHELYWLTGSTDSASDRLRSLIANSLGDPANYPIFYSRSRVASLAQAAGAPSPTTTNINDHAALFSQLENIGFPAVLKSDGSFGGRGVAIIQTPAEAKRAFDMLTTYNNVARTLKRIIVDRDANLVLPCLRRSHPQLSIQRFLPGKRANAAVACWKGTVLSQVCVEVIESSEATGPATVVRVIADPGMSRAVERLVCALDLSGLCGFDFILDPSDGSAHLIDFNPRATQTCHLLSSEGTQPVTSLATKLRGVTSVADNPLSPHRKPVVLFPHWLAYEQKNDYSKYEVDLPSKSRGLVTIGRELYRRKTRCFAKVLRLAKKN